jgi:hypothetical protein
MKAIFVMVFLSFIIVACTTTKGTSAFECGAGGAAGGFLLCKALGGKNEQCATVAILTGVAGSAICYTYAASLEKRQQELVGKENDLDARLRYVRGVNEDSANFNQQLRQRVAKVTQHTDEVVAQIAKHSLSQDQIVAERKALDNEVKSAKDQLALEKHTLEEMKTFQAQQSARNRRDFEPEITKLEKSLAETQKHIALLASQPQRIA